LEINNFPLRRKIISIFYILSENGLVESLEKVALAERSTYPHY